MDPLVSIIQQVQDEQAWATDPRVVASGNKQDVSVTTNKKIGSTQHPADTTRVERPECCYYCCCYYYDDCNIYHYYCSSSRTTTMIHPLPFLLLILKYNTIYCLGLLLLLLCSPIQRGLKAMEGVPTAR